MALQAKQTIQQRLLLAPNVTLALEILRMPAMELQVFLRQQAEENPLLEVDLVEPEEQESSTESAEGDGPAPEPASPEEDWVANWREASGEEPEEKRPGRDVPSQLLPVRSLHEFLRLQVGCQSLPETLRRLADALLDRLTEEGYLDTPLDQVAADLGVGVEHAEEALAAIQRCEPPGVGARDLRECLLLQLADGRDSAAGEGAVLARRMLRDHYPLFVQHRLDALARATGASLSEIEAACERLRRLNPKPGQLFSGDISPTVIPDLIVRRREEHYDVELNDDSMPTVHISRAYQRMLRNPETPTDAKEFLAKKFRQAGWVIRAIDERNTTVVAIGRCLISLQREFLNHGPKALKPLTQTQVAELIGRHPSTVSRAIAGKTMDTPYGIFRLEQFFASAVLQADTTHLSDAAIKSAIEQLIAEEDRHRPLSDEALVQRLKQRSIAVARRTVAKYRTTLQILPAHLRRRRL